jgi:methylmalonyl-CoA/ethylmalonyl-CoA epimerase
MRRSTLAGSGAFRYTRCLGVLMENLWSLAAPARAAADLVLGIGHVALAVRELDSAVRWYSGLFGFPVLHRGEILGRSANTSFAVLRMGDAPIVLLQGSGPASHVSRFIDRYGPGVHHVALRVQNVHAAVGLLRAALVDFDIEPLQDGDVTRAFLARTPGSGIRIALVDGPPETFSELMVERVFREFERKDLI